MNLCHSSGSNEDCIETINDLRDLLNDLNPQRENLVILRLYNDAYIMTNLYISGTLAHILFISKHSDHDPNDKRDKIFTSRYDEGTPSQSMYLKTEGLHGACDSNY